VEPEAKSLRGNVFSQIGFDQVEAVHLRVRSQLMTALIAVIRDRGLSQRAAASLFGVSQPRVSDLVRGRIDRFSCDMLIKMLARAGVGVEVRVSAINADC
jgi:predicted XRE-type DNA-binding protein